MNLKKILFDCYHFIMRRKKDEGGFAATPLLPATVQDTYHALKTLGDLKELDFNIDYAPQNDNALKSWLSKRKFEKEPKVFYQLLKSYKISSLKIDKNLIKQYITFFKGVVDLERYFYLAKLSELAESNLHKIDKTFKCKIAKDFWMFIYLSEKGFLNSKIDKSKIIEWFIECQNPDGGFGFSPGTTSYMDNTYFCLKALNFLGSKLKNPKNTLDFILFCQTKSGGFARTPHAVAFLDSTFYAVESLRILKRWEQIF